MVKKIMHNIYQYTAIFEPDEEAGGFTVTIPSFEEALENIRDAIKLHIEDRGAKEEKIDRKESVSIAMVEVVA